MNYLFMGLCAVTLSLQSILKKAYHRKCRGGELLFSTMVSLFALVVFLFRIKGQDFSPKILPFAGMFAVCYAITTVAAMEALRIGSLAITVLILSYSLVIPAVYGFLFWEERPEVLQMIGMLCLVVSLVLTRNESNGEKKRASAKWVIYTLAAFFTNGFCSVVQRQQQINFQGKYDTTFMITALFLVTVFLGIVTCIREKRELKTILCKGGYLAALCGICNGVTNLLVMVCLVSIPASVFFPIISAGQLVIVFLISLVFFREKFIKRQIAGFVVGVAAIVFMNL